MLQMAPRESLLDGEGRGKRERQGIDASNRAEPGQSKVLDFARHAVSGKGFEVEWVCGFHLIRGYIDI